MPEPSYCLPWTLQLLESQGDAAIACTADGVMCAQNRRAEELFGSHLGASLRGAWLRPDELLVLDDSGARESGAADDDGADPVTHRTPAEAEGSGFFDWAIAPLLLGGSAPRARWELRRPARSSVVLQVSMGPLPSSIGIDGMAATREGRDQPAGLIVFRDVTLERELVHAVAHFKQRYEKIFRTSPIPISISSLENGRFVDVNNAFLRLFEYEQHEIIGKSVLDTNMWLDPLERARVIEGVRTHGTVPGVEVRLCTKAGVPKHIFGSADAIDVDGERCFLALMIDVTMQKQLQAQLLQSQKMEAIGRLAGGIAHDFNNMLSAILGFATLVRDELPPASPSAGDVQQIIDAAEKSAHLTRQLLAFSRRQVLEPRVLHPNVQLNEMEPMVRRILGEDIRLRLDLAGDVGHVTVDAGQLHQVMMNLLVNARDAMPHGGEIVISSTNESSNESAAGGADPAEYVAIAVTDSGTGIDEETRAHVFEPFFTTKEHGKGTGLGLSTVLGIVQQSGGRVELHSEVGRGTTFRVLFPRTGSPTSPPPTSETRGDVDGDETVLVAEDEETVREYVVQALRRHGYRVLAASTVDGAIQLAKEYDGHISLLLSDVVMPNAGGRVLAESILSTRPDTRVLFMSGYTEDVMVYQGALSEGMHFLSKPVTPDALLRKVRLVIDLDAPKSRRASTR